MNRTRLDPTALAVLHSLDAAPARPLSQAQSRRADATLADILATDPGSAPVSGSAPTRRRRRWLALAAAAAAGALAFTVLPVSPGAQDPAYATWKAVPDRIPLDAAGGAAAYCLKHAADHTDERTEAGLEAATVAFAERRGVWTYVMLAGPSGFQASCLTDTTFEDGMIGAVGTPLDYREPAPREIVLGSCCGGGGTIKDGVKNFIGEVEGYAGSEVTGIAVLTPARGRVEATVGGGQFAAWWPDNDSDTRPRRPLTFVLTFIDGTTEQVTLAPPP